MNLFFFPLLSFTYNYIKVKFIFYFFRVFSLYLFFILFFIFFVLNNCKNVVVGFFFIWDQFLVDLFIGFLNVFHMIFFSWIYLLQICSSWFSSSFFQAFWVLWSVDLY
jgi:hypothetical protein